MNNNDLYTKLMKGIRRGLNESFGGWSEASSDNNLVSTEDINNALATFMQAIYNLMKRNFVKEYRLSTITNKYDVFNITPNWVSNHSIDELYKKLANMVNNTYNRLDKSDKETLRIKFLVEPNTDFYKYLGELYNDKIQDNEYNKVKDIVRFNKGWSGDVLISVEIKPFIEHAKDLAAWLG